MNDIPAPRRGPSFTHQRLYAPGAPPFLSAVQSGDLTLRRLLTEHGADPALATTNGPLLVASGIGWVEGVTYEWSETDTLAPVRLLLEVDADVTAPDEDGRTARHGTAHKGRNDVLPVPPEGRTPRLGLRDRGLPLASACRSGS